MAGVCTPPPPPIPSGPIGAYSVGDPHLATWGHVAWDVQLAGEDVLTTDDADFVLQARQCPWGSVPATVNVAFATRINNKAVTVDTGRADRVHVDGAAIDLSLGPRFFADGSVLYQQDASFIFAYANGAFAIVRDAGSYLDIRVFRGTRPAGGLHGLWGDDVTGQLTTRDNSDLAAVLTYAEVRRVASTWSGCSDSGFPEPPTKPGRFIF